MRANGISGIRRLYEPYKEMTTILQEIATMKQLTKRFYGLYDDTDSRGYRAKLIATCDQKV